MVIVALNNLVFSVCVEVDGPKIAGFCSLGYLVKEYLAIVGYHFGSPIRDYLMVKMTSRTQSSMTSRDHTFDIKMTWLHWNSISKRMTTLWCDEVEKSGVRLGLLKRSTSLLRYRRHEYEFRTQASSEEQITLFFHTIIYIGC